MTRRERDEALSEMRAERLWRLVDRIEADRLDRERAEQDAKDAHRAECIAAEVYASGAVTAPAPLDPGDPEHRDAVADFLSIVASEAGPRTTPHRTAGGRAVSVPSVTVSRKRTLTFDPWRDVLDVETLRELTDGCGAGQVVSVTTTVSKGDRPGESDRTTITMEVDE